MYTLYSSRRILQRFINVRSFEEHVESCFTRTIFLEKTQCRPSNFSSKDRKDYMPQLKKIYVF